MELSDLDKLDIIADSLLKKMDQGELDLMPPFNEEWLHGVSPKFTWNWRHLLLLQTYLRNVAEGKIKKLMIWMPPRHGKSELATIRFPVWWLERDPSQRVIIGAYNQTLANKFSRKIRKIAQERIDIDQERRAVDEWETEAGGGIRAVGVGGGITGMGGNLIVIDDPVKSRKEANSITYRNAAYDWYTDDIYTRREPGGAIIIIQTRWHEDDLCGRILAMEEEKLGTDEGWTILNLPAICESGDDPLNRQIGEALCPERFNEEQLLDIKRVLGRGFDALYQQRPVEQEGGFFKRSWFRFVNELPNNPMKWMRYWDKASTPDGDYTAGVLIAQDKATKLFYIVDVVRAQLYPHARDQLMLKTAYNDRERYGNVKIRHEQEPGSSGIDSAKATSALLAGFPVKAIRATGKKIIRAEPFQGQCESGNVLILRSSWNTEYIDELCSFPQGKNDDMVDASSGAFNELVKSRAVIFRGSG